LSDVGVAMGERGSDVSREVADLVLMDDNFATIVSAIEEGRNIYENIQKFIRFLFSTNLAEILIVVGGAFGAVLMGLRDETGAILLPLTAVQLLWVNIITDGPPALALGLDQDPSVMRQRPRNPQSPLLDRESLRFILTTGCVKAAIGGALLMAMPHIGFTLMETRTAIFLHATIGQLFYAYPLQWRAASGGDRGSRRATVDGAAARAAQAARAGAAHNGDADTGVGSRAADLGRGRSL
jgi:P-type Ca2+ transporter type 2C